MGSKLRNLGQQRRPARIDAGRLALARDGQLGARLGAECAARRGQLAGAQRHAAEAPKALAALQQAAIDNVNVFEKLMDAVRVCSLGQITNALFEVGGQYRRNM